MAKTSIQQILDEGFRAEQFGSPPDWDTQSGGYLARVIDDAALLVQARVGATLYASTDAATASRIAQGEKAWCIAILWKRRAAFLDSNTLTGMSAPENRVFMERDQYLKTSASAMDQANAWLSDAATAGAAQDIGAGASLGAAESGPFRSLATGCAPRLQ